MHLYVHIPYCVHKCHYCDFNSHERNRPDWDAYRKALIAELRCRAAETPFAGRRLTSIFFGGGTPSLAPPSLIGSVIERARNTFDIADDIEITLEANPGTVDAGHFAAYRQAGVNRLSIGVQSLDRRELRWLERIHDGKQARQAFRTAREAGFDNINLDLMYALPGQTPEHWLKTLDAAIAMRPEHLSCYQLTIEPHTRLAASHARKPYPMPDDETALSFFLQTRQRLERAGFIAYEISNFARDGHACRHNDGYWLYHDYIGIGAGAAGKWDRDDGGIVRYSNIRTPERYIERAVAQGTAVNGREELDRDDAAAEACWLGLRRRRGIDRQTFRHRFGRDVWDMFGASLSSWRQQGLLEVGYRSVRLGETGLPLADAIAASVL